jgi:hypothetical protein
VLDGGVLAVTPFRFFAGDAYQNRGPAMKQRRLSVPRQGDSNAASDRNCDTARPIEAPSFRESS